MVKIALMAGSNLRDRGSFAVAVESIYPPAALFVDVSDTYEEALAALDDAVLAMGANLFHVTQETSQIQLRARIFRTNDSSKIEILAEKHNGQLVARQILSADAEVLTYMTEQDLLGYYRTALAMSDPGPIQ